MFNRALMDEIRGRFHHVDHCPYQGARIFFENAGGSLTLKSVVEVSARLAAIPDNQGRDNPASAEMMRLIRRGRADMMTFLGATDGRVFVGETGTECLFRVIRAAVLEAAGEGGGRVLGSTLEHPATASAGRQWAARMGMEYTAIPHDPHTGVVGAEAYRRYATEDTRVATLIQTSPVTGMAVDVQGIVAAVRAVAPGCFIVVDGIQHAPHGGVDIGAHAIDAYAVSGYKVFSRHNYGFAWVSPRLAAAPHDRLDGTAGDFWELGTRDAAAYATFSEVVDYLDWLGAGVMAAHNAPAKRDAPGHRRARITAAGKAIADHEKRLTEVMLRGADGQKGLADMPEVGIIGGADNHHREGLVSLVVEGVPCARVVSALGGSGVRVHIRKNDYFSGNILTPLGLETCVRVSMCHYNTPAEVKHFLNAMEAIVAAGRVVRQGSSSSRQKVVNGNTRVPPAR